MLHLQAIPEEKASDDIKLVYQDIKEVFHLATVPLVFQYIANFEKYLLYIWEQLRADVLHASFVSLEREVSDFAHVAIKRLYTPDASMKAFILQLPPSQKTSIVEIVSELIQVNSKLLILLIALRESLKGVIIGTPLLGEKNFMYQTKRQEVIQSTEEIFSPSLQKISSEVHPATTMLAPLFGQNTMVVSLYPDFFTRIAREMEKLVTKESYLQERVELEKVTLRTIERFPRPLENSYQRLVALAGEKPYFTELLYLLSETFPTQFPRLVITSAMMRQSCSSSSEVSKL